MPVLNIAGFWRRGTAFVLDMLLLGIVGWIAGALFFDTFVKLGSYGRIIGFVVQMVYFVPLDSRLGRGQTLGKRIADIQVVDAQGQYLSVPRALLRYAVLGVPLSLNGIAISFDKRNMALAYIAGFAIMVIVFGGLLSLTYLYIFNRRTHQSLHDLAVGSYVVWTKSPKSAQPLQPFWRGHIIVIGIVVLLSLIVSIIMVIMTQTKLSKEAITRWQAVSQQIDVLPNVRSAQYMSSNKDDKIHDATIIILLNTADINNKSLAEAAFRIAVAHDAALAKDGTVSVYLIYSYDIGIVFSRGSRLYQFKSGELQVID
jgi:uncharacterized RDD family membrane protein YckC